MNDSLDMMEGVMKPGGGLIFPANRDEITRLAQEKHLPPDVISSLQKIPDREYANIGELVAAVSKVSS